MTFIPNGCYNSQDTVVPGMLLCPFILPYPPGFELSSTFRISPGVTVAPPPSLAVPYQHARHHTHTHPAGRTSNLIFSTAGEGFKRRSMCVPGTERSLDKIRSEVSIRDLWEKKPTRSVERSRYEISARSFEIHPFRCWCTPPLVWRKTARKIIPGGGVNLSHG